MIVLKSNPRYDALVSFILKYHVLPGGLSLKPHSRLSSSVPRSSGDVSATYRCEASDGTKQAMAQANIKIYTKPVITTSLPTAPVKKSSSKLGLSVVIITFFLVLDARGEVSFSPCLKIHHNLFLFSMKGELESKF